MATDVITGKDTMYKISSGESVQIIDSRSEDVYTEDSDQIQGAVHLPEIMVHETYMELPKDKEYVIYATKGDLELSKRIADFMKEKGFTAYALEGGYEEWRDSDLPIEPINAPGTPLL